MSAAASAAPEKSVYLVFAHGSEVLVGFNENDPIAARPTVPDGIELVLFESCGGYLPTSVDSRLIKLFQDTSAPTREMLENPGVLFTAKTFKDKIGLPRRVYRPGQPHPEIDLTLQASWSKGKCSGLETDVYSIMKSGTYEYPLTDANFPPITAYENLDYCMVPLPIADPEYRKYAALYTEASYKKTIRNAFVGSVLPTMAEVNPSGSAGYRHKPMHLSKFLAEMRLRTGGRPAVIYIITCRAIPPGMMSYFEYHKGTFAKIKKASPERPRMENNIDPYAVRKAVLAEAASAVAAAAKSHSPKNKRIAATAAKSSKGIRLRSPVMNASLEEIPVSIRRKIKSRSKARRAAAKESAERRRTRKAKRLVMMEEASN